ncbi:MAG: ADOP family duplicated permease [Gemmatimonadaceae bacterium]
MVRNEWWDAVTRDVRYAACGLRAKPGFTAAVVLTLALGIGANAAIFSAVDRLLFRPPPLMAEPALTHRVYLASRYRGEEVINGSVQYARYVDLTKWTRSFARTAEFTSRKLAVGVGDAAREMQIGAVSASFFGFFDAPPALGRYFSAREDAPPSGTPVVVLSYAMWQTRYGGRPDALGSTVQIGPTMYTVIGVAPAGFVGLWPEQPPVAFVPISSYAAGVGLQLKDETWWTTYHWTWASMMAERKPGVSVAAATADLTSAYRRSRAAQREIDKDMTPETLARPRAIIASILSERGPDQSSVAKVAALVGAMALVVLLIACANVANLLLARALRRRREIAVRVALGVSRTRLLSQLLSESMLLAVMGGVGGLLVGQWGGAALRAALLPEGAKAPVLGDTRTLLFAGGAVLVAGLLTGLAPVLQARRTDLTLDLKAGAREGNVHRSRARTVLLVLQGALAVILLVGAGLFVRSLHNVKNLRLGYDVSPVLVVNLAMRGVKLDSAPSVTLRRRLLETAQAIPGVDHAALITSLPFYSEWSVGLFVPGIDSVDRLGQFNLNAVTPDYFTTMGTRILRGRGIEPRDVAGAPGAVVVSTAMAKKLWPREDALGKCIRVNADSLPCSYVVGIAEDIKSEQLSGDPGLYYYLSAPQFNLTQTMLLVRTQGRASEHADVIRRRLQQLMPGASYVTVTPFSDIVSSQTRAWSLGSTMFAVFGGLALLLATIGLYGVIAYNVAQRAHEMGVRIAIGAQAGDVVWLVVRQGVLLGGLGIVIGGAVALAFAGRLEPLLFGEPARDPLVYLLVAAAMLAVAAAASFIPARRASRVDPTVALRAE